MSWLDSIIYGMTPGNKVSARYNNLFEHRALPGLLLRRVMNKQDLLANCQGFLVMNSNGDVLSGYVGLSAKLMYDRPFYGQPVEGSLSGTHGVNYSASVMHAEGVSVPVGLRALLGNGSDMLQAMSPSAFASHNVMNMTSNRDLNNPMTGTIHQRLTGADPVSVATTTLRIVGIVTRAVDGMFLFGAALSSTPVSAVILKRQIMVGWMSEQFSVGTLREIVAARKETMVADAPSDVRKYYASAIDHFLESAASLKLGKLTFATTWQMSGTVGNWTRSHGLPTPGAYTVRCRSSNFNTGPLYERFIDFPTIDRPFIFGAFKVQSVGDDMDVETFGSLATGHAMAAAIDADSDKFAPLLLGGDNISTAVSRIGDLWLTVEQFSAAEIVSSSVPVTDGTANQMGFVSSLGGVTGSSTLMSALFNHKLGAPLFEDLQKAVVSIYKRAEQEIKDS